MVASKEDQKQLIEGKKNIIKISLSDIFDIGIKISGFNFRSISGNPESIHIRIPNEILGSLLVRYSTAQTQI